MVMVVLHGGHGCVADCQGFAYGPVSETVHVVVCCGSPSLNGLDGVVHACIRRVSPAVPSHTVLISCNWLCERLMHGMGLM